MGEEIQVELRDHGEGGRRRPRPRSASFIAVRSAVFQLTSLSDFKLEKIGSGFFADVYKVYHKGTGEVMVLKMNKSRKTSKQMLSEIQLMNRLCHPNILRFKGSCVHEGHLHALTEYINNGSLEDLLHNRKVDLTWSVRVKIARDIAKGMAYLHSKGIFHRDLTSKNCLIQKEPNGVLRTVVADFGLAARIKQACRRSHTEVVGSPYWMAPELLRGKSYCEQADVFSYGIILAEIMARIPADPDFMPRTHLFGMDFDALRKMCLGCPEDLWLLMCRCCQINPDDRPTFDEAVTILEQVEVGEDQDSNEASSDTDQDLRSCISEPVMRLHDSDEELTSSSSEADDSHILNQKLGSLDSCSDKEPIKILANDVHTGENSSVQPLNQGVTQMEDVSYQTLLSDTGVHSLITEEEESEDEKSVNKGGDSGIDPGEVLCAAALSCSFEAGLNTVGGENTLSLKAGSKMADVASGDETPLCASPSLSRMRDRKVMLETTDSIATPILTRSSWDTSIEYTAHVTPGQSATPLAQSWTSSEFSFNLPSPSTPWAPPPSPAVPFRLSTSLPTSPTLKRRFRRSLGLESDHSTDSSTFLQPHRRSVPSPQSHSQRNSALFQDAVDQMHNTIYEEGTENDMQFWNSKDLCTCLEHQFSQAQYNSPNCRSRSHSNPAFAIRKQSLNYTLTLARHSPDSIPSSAASYKWYNIRLRKNARLSSSAPNLPSLCSPVS